MVLGRKTDKKVRLIVFIFFTLKLQKENSPRRGGSFLCDQKEGNIRPFAHPGSPRVPRPLGLWPCSDTDSVPFDDRPLSKLKESDRCSARENLYLDTLSLDDEPEEPPARGPQREFENCLPEVGLGFWVLGFGSSSLSQTRGLLGNQPCAWQAAGLHIADSLWVE